MHKQKMKRVSADEHTTSEPLVWNEGLIPTAGPGQILVRVAAFGINHVDLEQKMKLYPRPAGAGPIYGLELSGTVVAIGPGVKKFSVGDRVMSLVTDGAYAEYAICQEEVSLLLPSYLSFEEGAAIPESLYTLTLNLWQKTALKSEETVLIHGMAGAIGTLAIPLIKAWGSKVYGTVSSPVKQKFCLDLGADNVFLRNSANWTNQSIDIVLDCLGGEIFEKSLAILNKKGRIALIDCIYNEKASIDLGSIITKQISIFGSVLRPLAIKEKAELTKFIELNLLPLMIQNQIKAPIHRIWSMHQLEEAHQTLKKANGFGKNVVRIEEYN